MADEGDGLINVFLEEMPHVHFPSGYMYSGNNKLNSLLCTEENELDTIYNLIEAHAPGVRYISLERYQKVLDTLSNVGSLNFKCGSRTDSNKLHLFLNYLEDMPKEWAIVQLTSEYEFVENLKTDSGIFHTSAIHLTVLNCGANQLPPVTITLQPPVDTIGGNIIPIRQELNDIISDNEAHLKKFKERYNKTAAKFISNAERLIYVDNRTALTDRLEGLVNVIQNKWLDAWRCLFIGKFVDNKLEETVVKLVDDQLKRYNYQGITEKNKTLLIYLVKGSGYLNLTSLKTALKWIFPRNEDKTIRCAFVKLIQNKEYNFEEQKRYPLILVVDEQLDSLPWEMIDILQKQSVSRLPSFHFVHSLFKVHEKNIVNGFVEINNSNSATYVVNPGLDLNAMQLRMTSFFKYWRPDWSGIVGVEPSEEEFLNTLTTSNIFIYCGHGSGTQFVRGEDIQRTKVNSVVFLFGCGSIKLCAVGPQAESYSSYYNYLVASSPCVIGMLWIVTDYETDELTTELLSQWVPSKAPVHWKHIAKDKWASSGFIKPTNNNSTTSEVCSHEPELLRALSNAKNSSAKYITRAACIARGLPIKLTI